MNKETQRYRDQIEVYCGLEFDMYSKDRMQGYDYIIGTLHYLKSGDNFIGLDRSAEAVKDIINVYFNGNGLEYVKSYMVLFRTHYKEMHLACRIFGKMDMGLILKPLIYIKTEIHVQHIQNILKLILIRVATNCLLGLAING